MNKFAMLIVLLAASLAFAGPTPAQTASAKKSGAKSASASSPLADAVRAALARQAKNLIASGEEMPADKFSFKPTPAQMSFGHLMMHITQSNFFLCSRLAGKDESAPPLAETDAKDKLIAAEQLSFEYCTQVLSHADDSDLNAKIEFFGGREITRAAAMVALTNDLADHYAAAAMYLRLNGLLPPTAQPRK